MYIVKIFVLRIKRRLVEGIGAISTYTCKSSSIMYSKQLTNNSFIDQTFGTLGLDRLNELFAFDLEGLILSTQDAD